MTRTFLPRLRLAPLVILFAAAAGLVALAAAPPEVEDPKAKPPAKKVAVEDEDPKGTVKKKVVVDDPDTRPKAGGTDPGTKLDELVKAAAETPRPALKAVFERYAVPFDRLTDTRGQAQRIVPIPLFRTDRFPDQFGVTDLDAMNQPQPLRNVAFKEVKRFDYFEELLLADAEAFVKPPAKAPGAADPTADEQLAAAEVLLAAGLRFHDHARQADKRQGKAWDAVRKPLDDRLREVRLKQLQGAVAAANWPRARTFGATLLTAYPKDAEVARAAAAAWVGDAERLVQSKEFTDHAAARKLLDDLDTRAPGAGGDAARKVRTELTAEARRHVERAKGFKAGGNLVDARNDTSRADALDPTVPGLQQLKQELGSGSPVLYVGVRGLPEKMSPATARFDSERQAVELLFEGLLEEVPGGTAGVSYRPGAALALPTVVPGGRELLVRQTPRTKGGADGFNAHDVVETVRMLRTRPDLWAAAGLPWLDDVPDPTGPGGLRLAFRHGHPDPRALLTFKVLPARALAARNQRIDDPGFAARPAGTGPYRVHSVSDAKAARRELAFTANPAYDRGKDRTGRPHVREIRFVDLTPPADPQAVRLDPIKEFRDDNLHLLPDLTPDEMTRALSQNGSELGGKAVVVTAAAHRRVHVLAVNHRLGPLQNRDLRRGLSLAIDRDAILGAVFAPPRGEYKLLTAAMSGPFPPGAWATVKGPGGLPVPLLNQGQATASLRQYLGSPGAATELRLAYPATDAQAAAACAQIKAQVEGLFKDAPDGRKLTLALDPLPPRELLLRVEDEHRYDLAYIPFDYPDDWFPFGLAAYLDKTAAGRGGRNVTGYLAADTNPDDTDRALESELAGLREHRDFTGDLAPRATRIHKLFNDAVPFVPLWQLDRYTLVSTRLKVFVGDETKPVSAQVLDPTVLFHNVARWRLE